MNLVRYKLWHDSYSKRLVAVCGDLERPLLGLKAAHFNVLAGQLDAIYHNGARVNNVETYARLKPANVFATAELLRLASQIRIKPLHFVSTIAIAADCAEPQLVREDHRFASSSLPPTGYVASKWVAEQLVWTASERGLPVTVHRPGRICGDTKSGVTGNDDAFWQLIKAMLELEAIPDLVHHENSFVDLIPVDHVARAIVHISRQPQSIGKAFHLTCESDLDVGVILEELRRFGYCLSTLPYDRWVERLEKRAGRPSVESNGLQYRCCSQRIRSMRSLARQRSVRPVQYTGRPGRMSDCRVIREPRACTQVHFEFCRIRVFARSDRKHVMTNPFEDNSGSYLVLVNDQGQRSLWPTALSVPDGWNVNFGPMSRRACLEHIDATWTDMRPKRLGQRSCPVAYPFASTLRSNWIPFILIFINISKCYA